MFLRQKIDALLRKVRRVPAKYYFIGAVICVMAVYVVAFREQTLAYNYNGNTCDNRLIILPGLFAQSGGTTYEVTTRGGWSIGGRQLTATTICVSPVAAPPENASESVAYAPWGGWLARYTYTVTTGEHPSVDMAVLDKPIPASRELLFPISEPDTTFSYTLEANETHAPCESEGNQIACDVPSLKLKQGSTYEATLEKYFKDERVDEVAAVDLETLSPLSVVKTSIRSKEMVYSKPKSITLTTDKSIKQADIAVSRTDGKAPERLATTTEVSGKKVVVTFADELPREATIAVQATVLEAVDGSTPLDTQLLTFTTSAGPRVTGSSVGSSGIPVGARIAVTFDQKLSDRQDLEALITTKGGVGYQGRSGNQLFFSTSNAKRCATVSIELKSGIESAYGISGKSDWQFKGRMSCYTVSTIGYSAGGRPINAYHFGDGGSSIVYTGAIHGNEVGTKLLMDRWIQELDAHPEKIPAGKRISVVPTINPDGFAAGTRVNARGVDLNRNFATSDWQKNIQHVDGSAFKGGGGAAPMSEPETKAIAKFIAQQRPVLVLSYHSVGWMVISNQGGQAGARASQYAGLSGYRLSGGGGGEFGYQITGTADDYYREKLGVASVLIETGSHSYHQFELNQAAMWAMLR